MELRTLCPKRVRAKGHHARSLAFTGEGMLSPSNSPSSPVSGSEQDGAGPWGLR